MTPDHIIECAARAVHEKHGQHIAPRYMDAPTWYRDDLEAQIATALEAVAADIWDEGSGGRDDLRPNPYREQED